MDLNKYTRPSNLEKYSFMWSLARLLVASATLIITGTTPIVYVIFSYYFGNIVGIAWIISGLAAAYLLYRWNQAGHKLFGKKDAKDMAAFLVMTVSGINLGIAGLVGVNMGMMISSARIVLIITGVLYLLSAYHLHKRWTEEGKKLFHS